MAVAWPITEVNFLNKYYLELNMKKKLLCCALLAGMSLAQSAMAQSYDDRFYVTVGAGLGMFDNDRGVKDEVYGTLGFGKFISPNVSIDAELWGTNPQLDHEAIIPPALTPEERNWEMTSLELVGRYHFIHEGRSWNPYIAAGIGAQHHGDGTQRQPVSLGYSKSRSGTNVAALVGVGIQADLGWPSLRGEFGLRYDGDNEGLSGNHYVDRYAGLTLLFPIGAEPAPAAEVVAVAQKTCADLDDDGDGVNNCNDKCPGSQAGEALGPDGCPVPAAEPEPTPEPKPFKG